MSGTGRKGKKKAGAAGIGTILLVVVAYVLLGPEAFREIEGGLPPAASSSGGAAASAVAGAGLDRALRDAIRNERSEVMVTLNAEVVKVLPDDNEGSRHQRLLLVLDEAVGDVDTILIAHNIDLAERVPCDEGERLLIRGQYEWNDKGGVIHWTHHDPKKWREGGWIEHEGVRYE